MSRFVVRFMKNVLGENGREAEVCQGSLEIDASNEGQPRNWQSENSAKRRRFTTGRSTPTESMSARPIFRPENSSCISGGDRALDRRAGQPRLSATALLAIWPR